MSYAYYWTAVFFVLTIVACLICVALVRAMRALAEAIVAELHEIYEAVNRIPWVVDGRPTIVKLFKKAKR